MLLPQISSCEQSFANLDAKIAEKKGRRFLLSTKLQTLGPEHSEKLNDFANFQENFAKTPENSANILSFSQKNQASNLFKTLPSQNPADFKQFNFGPRFDNNGLVIPHSIVGKPDVFMNHYSREDKKSVYSHTRIESKDGKSLVIDAKKNEKKMKSPKTNEENALIFSDKVVKGEKRSSLLKPTGAPARKPQKNKLNIQDLLADLNKSVERHQKASLEDLQTINNLETSDKLYLTKQSRILDLYSSYETRWGQQLGLVSRKIKRKPEFSVVNQADLYRPRQETAEAFQNTLSDYEKYGDRVWYMTLRLYGVDPNEMKKVLYINDLPDGFKRAIVEKRSNIIEKIRKPNKTYSETESLFKTFTSQDYLKEKIHKNRKVLNGVLAGCFAENFQDFQVFFFLKIRRFLFI